MKTVLTLNEQLSLVLFAIIGNVRVSITMTLDGIISLPAFKFGPETGLVVTKPNAFLYYNNSTLCPMKGDYVEFLKNCLHVDISEEIAELRKAIKNELDDFQDIFCNEGVAGLHKYYNALCRSGFLYVEFVTPTGELKQVSLL